MATDTNITERDCRNTEVLMQDVAAAADDAARRMLAMATTESQKGIIALVALASIERTFAAAVRS